MNVKFGVDENGMLVAQPNVPIIPGTFEIIDWQPHQDEKRTWRSSRGRLLIPRGEFHLHINYRCTQMSWDGYKLVNTINGTILHDVTIGMPPRSMMH